MQKEELIDQMTKFICDPTRLGIDKPFWEESRLAITDGSIAVIFKCQEKLDEWSVFSKADDFFKLCDKEGTLINVELPMIEPQKDWENPFEQIKDECEECNGTGYVECNYGHEHECEECESDGWVLSNAFEKSRLPVEERYIELPDLGLFDRRYLWILSQLAKYRQLQYSFDEAGQKLYFSFEDGNGLLMGVQKRV